MEYASNNLFLEKQQEFNPRSEPKVSGNRGLWSSRSAKCLFLGGLAASLGAMESAADRTAEVAKVSSNLPMPDVGLVPVGEIPKVRDYVSLTGRDGSCMQGVVFGGLGLLLVQNPLPLLVGLAGCLSGVSAQQMVGNEFRVNTWTNNQQERPSVANFSNGNFVVTWMSTDQDGSFRGVYGQLFYGNSTKFGSEFQVNSYTNDNQEYPSVASLSNGNFVVTWESDNQDGSFRGVYGQLFYGNSTKFGNEFQVNTYTDSNQRDPSVASLNNGNFVVTWESLNQDGSSYGIYGQLFDLNATKLRNEFQANTYTTDGQQYSSVASFINGNFVVTWHGFGQDGSDHGIYGQLFGLNATKLGNEFQVNTYTTNGQEYPSVASLSNSAFVVAWHSHLQDGSDEGVYGQLFDGNANRIGNEFRVNTYTNDSQAHPLAASLSNGSFIIAWQSVQDGSDYGVYGQLFDSSIINNSTISTTSEIITSSSSNFLSSTSNQPITTSSITTSSSSSSLSSSRSSQQSSSTSGMLSSSSSSSISTSTQLTSTFPTTSSSTPITSTTIIQETVTSTSGNSSALWIGLGAGVLLCLGLTGGAVAFILNRRKQIQNSDVNINVSESESSTDSTVEDSFELPSVIKIHKEIGEK